MSLRGMHERQPTAEADSSGNMPESEAFDFRAFFTGRTRASGWFSDRFARPRKHFSGDFYGFDRDGMFVLEERLAYSDGLSEEKIWHITISDQGEFEAESDSLLGRATGLIRGNTLNMSYSTRVLIEPGKHWELDMQDTMYLQPNGNVHNIAQVCKWGIRLGTVSAQYVRLDESTSSSVPRLHIAS